MGTEEAHPIGRLGATLLLLALMAGNSLPSSLQAMDMKYSHVRISVSGEEEICTLRQAGLDFDHVRLHEDSFDAVLNERDLEVLRSIGKAHEILVDDMVADYHQRLCLPAKRTALEQGARDEFPVQGMKLGSMGGMYTFGEVVATLDSMRLMYPHLISARESIGPSFEGRPLWMVKISDHPDVDEGEPEILYTSLHHAREPIGLMAVLYFMYYLLEQYGRDPQVTFLVDNRELYFVPVVNPDGYVYNQETNPDGGGFWRGNRNLTSSGNGVDLNRNYGFEWAGRGIPSIGSGPFSEAETQAIRDFCTGREFRLALNYHDYSDGFLLHPWGFRSGTAHTPDSTTYRKLGAEMTELNGYPYGPVVKLINAAPGNHDDWMYGEQETKNKIMAMGAEVGASLWPRPDSIFSHADRMLHLNIVLARGPGVIPAGGGVSVVEDAKMEGRPAVFSLSQNYPNPLNMSTTITYRLHQVSDVQLAIYNLTGQKLTTLVAGAVEPGAHTVHWNGRDANDSPLASGAYLYRIRAGTQAETRRLLLLR